MRATTPQTSPTPNAYSARLSARYRNFLVPLLTLGVIGGFNALLTVQSGRGDAGWWPVAWLATMFLGVFFSAAFMAMAGQPASCRWRYGVALGATVGLGLTTYGFLQTSLHAPWGAVMPDWLRAQRRQEPGWALPGHLLIPYAAGLALHGATLLVFNRRTSPENRG